MKKKHRLLWPALFLLAIGAAPDAYWLIRMSLHQRSLSRALADATEEEARLTRLQDKLQNDGVYVEGLIRSTFKYAKPEEWVIPLAASSLSTLSDLGT